MAETDTRAWNDFDRELDLILTSTMQGPADRKLKCMTTLVYTMGREMFGTVKERRPKPLSHAQQETEPYETDKRRAQEPHKSIQEGKLRRENGPPRTTRHSQ